MKRSIFLAQITVTAKIQISVNDTDKVLLDETMSGYRYACNYVSNDEELREINGLK